MNSLSLRRLVWKGFNLLNFLATAENLLNLMEALPLAYWAIEMAEREGFEPPEPFGSVVFKTTAFGHSAISPCLD